MWSAADPPSERDICVIREIRKSQKYSQAKLAELAGISPEHLANIEKRKTDPALSVAWRIAQALRLPLHDLLTLGDYAADLGPWIRLPWYIQSKELVEQVAKYNGVETHRRYWQPDRYVDRVKIYLTFAETIARHEIASPIYKELGRAEYVQPEPYSLNPPDQLNLAEAFEALRLVKNISINELAKRAGINRQTLNVFANGTTELSLSGVDRACRVLGLTIDELIYVARAPEQHWPLLPLYGNYSNQEIINLCQTAGLNWINLTLAQRAELMLAFREWVTAEAVATSELQPTTEPVPTPTAFEQLVLWCLPTPA